MKAGYVSSHPVGLVPFGSLRGRRRSPGAGT